MTGWWPDPETHQALIAVTDALLEEYASGSSWKLDFYKREARHAARHARVEMLAMYLKACDVPKERLDASLALLR